VSAWRLAVEHLRIINFSTTENREIFNNRQYSNSKGFVVDFTYRPAVRAHPRISIKAKIEFQDINKKLLHFVNTGFWLNKIDDCIDLMISDTGSLTLAILFKSGTLNSYEHGTHRDEMGLTVPEPKIIPLDGQDFLINVELIVKQAKGEFVTSARNSFSISLKP